MRRALLVAFLVLALSLGIVAVAGAATIQGGGTSSVSLQPAAANAAAWVAGQSIDSASYSASYHDEMECDHGIRSAQDSSISY